MASNLSFSRSSSLFFFSSAAKANFSFFYIEEVAYIEFININILINLGPEALAVKLKLVLLPLKCL